MQSLVGDAEELRLLTEAGLPVIFVCNALHAGDTKKSFQETRRAQ
jgi:hypothetical protein